MWYILDLKKRPKIQWHDRKNRGIMDCFLEFGKCHNFEVHLRLENDRKYHGMTSKTVASWLVFENLENATVFVVLLRL